MLDNPEDRNFRYDVRMYPQLTPFEDGVIQARMWLDMMLNGYAHLHEDIHTVVREQALAKRAKWVEAKANGDEPEQEQVLVGYLSEFSRLGYLSRFDEALD